jgi:lipopolysaccharide export system permease protein
MTRLGVKKLRAFVAWFDTLRMREFVIDTLRMAAIVMVLVEAIFLSERFPMVFRDVLRNHAGFVDAAMILALNVPQIFDLALPLALLIATYTSVLGMRENRELLVLGAAGMGPSRLIVPIVAVSVAATICSVLVSGFINPLSLYAQRAVLFDAEYRGLTQGSGTGQLYFLNDRVVYAPRQPPGETAAPEREPASGAEHKKGGFHLRAPRQKRNVFLYEPAGPGRFRIILAATARVAGKEKDGYVPLLLGEVTSRVFRYAPSADEGSGSTDETFYATTAKQGMVISDLIPFPTRGNDGTELTLPELMRGRTRAGWPEPAVQLRLVGERIGRGLLCLIAPLLAMIAVGVTSRLTLYLALPLGCMTLMSLNVSTEWLLRTLTLGRASLLTLLMMALTGAGMAILLALIVRGQRVLLRPQLARA